jgi:hypothetical protein
MTASGSEEKNILVGTTLQEILFALDIRPRVLADCRMLIDQEIADKSGACGPAIKLAYKAATSFEPGYFGTVLQDMLLQIVDKLEPYWADFSTCGGSEFSDCLSRRGPEVAGICSHWTDQVATVSKRSTIVKTLPRRPRQRCQAPEGRTPADR